MLQLRGCCWVTQLKRHVRKRRGQAAVVTVQMHRGENRQLLCDHDAVCDVMMGVGVHSCEGVKRTLRRWPELGGNSIPFK